jgi:3',5'-cyclic AMP phosphodiesterase CpdA
VTEPFLLVQLSDLHLGADWKGRDPVAAVEAAIRAVGHVRPRPAAVLVTGDLAESAADAEYERARELLETLGAPLHVLPGNHDDRAALRRHFDVPGLGDEPVNYAVDLGSLRLVVVDTTLPGEDGGALDAERLEWLDGALGEEPDAPTLLAMHHPPLVTGIKPLERIGLPPADRQALAAVVVRHTQVRRLVAGHMHRAIAASLAGRAVLAAPSTYLQARLDTVSDDLQLVSDPPGFAVHVLVDGELVSHVQPVG